MKFLITLFASLILVSCSSQKNVPGQVTNTTDSLSEAGSNETKAATPTKNIVLNNTESTGSDETKAATPTKSIILNNTESSDKSKTTKNSNSQTALAKIPSCLQKLVKGFL